MDGAAEDFHKVERVDVGETSADEGEDGVVVCGAESGSRFIGGGGVDEVGIDEGFLMVEGVGQTWQRRVLVGRHRVVLLRGFGDIFADHYIAMSERLDWKWAGWFYPRSYMRIDMT